MAIFQLQNKELSLTVNSFGAELCSVIANQTQIEYIWQADKMVWARHAPHLFPIVGKLKDGTFMHQSQSYQLPQHGFARDLEFTCIEQNEDQLVFELNDSEETLGHYPFQFKLQIKYTLSGNTVTTHYAVSNPNNKELYFSIGAHPAFNCPLESHESFEDYGLVFPGKNELTINVLNDGLITNSKKSIHLQSNRLTVSKTLFQNDALVFQNSQIQTVQLISKNTHHGVELKCIDWPYFGIWTKKETDQFVCLEPWYGIADSDTTDGSFVSKTGIISLPAHQMFNCFFDSSFF